MRGRLAVGIGAAVTALCFYWAVGVLSARLVALLGAPAEGLPISGGIVGGAAALGLAWHVGQGMSLGAWPRRAWIGVLLGLAAVALWSICEALIAKTHSDLASLAIGVPLMLVSAIATLLLGLYWRRLYLRDMARAA